MRSTCRIREEGLTSAPASSPHSLPALLASPPADSWQLFSQPAVPPETGPGQKRPLGAGSGQTEAAAHPQPDERSARGDGGREEGRGQGGKRERRERGRRGLESLLNALMHHGTSLSLACSSNSSSTLSDET